MQKLIFAPILALIGFHLTGCARIATSEFRNEEQSYVRAVEIINAKGKDIPLTLTPLEHFQDYPPGVKRIFAKRRKDGTLVVEFFRYGRFPVRHAGFLFDETDRPAEDERLRKRWRKWVQIKPRWFYIAD
jgi:hypothetical protein